MIIKGDYGVAQTILFPLYAADGSALTTGATFAAGDVVLIKDEGTPANSTNLPTHEGGGLYSLVLTATEKQAVRLGITIDDQTATELWLSCGIVIDTSVTIDGYGGGVWYNEAASGTGTTVGVHGTPLRPVNSFADAVTLAGTTGLKRVYVMDVTAGSFAASAAVGAIDVVSVGGRKTMSLNGQTFTNTRIIDLDVIDVGVSSALEFAGGLISCTASVMLLTGGAFDDITIDADGAFSTFGAVAHAGGAGITFGDDSKAYLRGFSGEVQLNTMDASNACEIDGTGKIVIAASCTGGTLVLRGQFKVIDNSAGAVTIDNTATGVNITQVAGNTARATALAAVLDNTEVLTVTALGTVNTIVCGGLSSTNNNSYINRVVLFRKDTATADLQGRPGYVTAYNGSTKTLTVDTLPAAPTTGDTFILMP